MNNGSYVEKALRDSQLHLLQALRYENTGKELMDQAAHEDAYLLLLVHQGGIRLHLEESEAVLLQNHFCLLPPRMRDACEVMDNSEVTGYWFRVCDEDLRRIVYPVHGCADGEELNELQQWHRYLMQYEEEPQPLTLFRVDCGFKGTLVSLLQKGQLQAFEKRHRIAPEARFTWFPGFAIAEFIRNHAYDRLTLLDIAKHFGFHPHYIIKICNDRIGKSPMQYLQDVRLEKAMDYLEMTELTVAEISDKLCWSTSYFSRLFHQKKGMSPTHYRKAVLAKGTTASKQRYAIL